MSNYALHVEEILGRNGLVARRHPKYERREGQIQMAAAVTKALDKRESLIVEAGTGVGKSLAYLIPAIQSGRKVVVSTASKALQGQLWDKDLVFLQETLPTKFHAAILKGRSNYLCLKRFDKAKSEPEFETEAEMEEWKAVARWAKETATGDYAELVDLPPGNRLLQDLNASDDHCVGKKCPMYESCFHTQAKRRAADASIIIVNHSLFFVDLALRAQGMKFLPDYDAVIFDEAHEIENVAAESLGVEVSSYRIPYMLRDISKLDQQDGAVLVAAAAVSRADDAFWLGVAEGLQDGPRVLLGDMFSNGTDERWRHHDLDAALDKLSKALSRMKDAPDDVEPLVKRIAAIRADLDTIVKGGNQDWVYLRQRRGKGVFLLALPVDVSTMLRDRLFTQVETVILASATLAAGNSFQFIRARLGLDKAAELIAESPFDYGRQSLMYMPPKMPDPKDAGYIQACADEIARIVRESRGRAFVLCTSNYAMRELRKLVEPKIDYPVMSQGDLPVPELVRKFREAGNAVLFAVATFWQGVDIQGDALSCVIIDKLPFDVHTDPLVAARQRHVEKKGGNSFNDYSVPSAIIRVKQGLGRLIRSGSDRGVLSILDPRLTSKFYGKTFLRSLPKYRGTKDMGDVTRFFAATSKKIRGCGNCNTPVRPNGDCPVCPGGVPF